MGKYNPNLDLTDKCGSCKKYRPISRALGRCPVLPYIIERTKIKCNGYVIVDSEVIAMKERVKE
ncbi:MAG: hypothetical protein PHO15_03615 [Eubacteriales bacterium]|nr:hypothetical protein [Eubacteriales bacterium]